MFSSFYKSQPFSSESFGPQTRFNVPFSYQETTKPYRSFSSVPYSSRNLLDQLISELEARTSKPLSPMDYYGSSTVSSVPCHAEPVSVCDAFGEWSRKLTPWEKECLMNQCPESMIRGSATVPSVPYHAEPFSVCDAFGKWSRNLTPWEKQCLMSQSPESMTRFRSWNVDDVNASHLLHGSLLDRMKDLRAHTFINDCLELLRGKRQSDNLLYQIQSGIQISPDQVLKAIRSDRVVDAGIADVIEKILDYRRRNSEMVHLSEHILAGKPYTGPTFNRLSSQTRNVAMDIIEKDLAALYAMTGRALY